MIRIKKIRRDRVPADPSRATDSDIDIPAPPGLQYLGYQKAGIVYALQRQNTLIADEMGLGKTPMSVGVSNCDPSIRKVLIISPASLKINWLREWTRFDVKKLTVEIVGKKWPDSDVKILNYDVLNKWRKELRQEMFDMLVADESHFLKSAKAIRTREVLGGIKRDADKKIIDRVSPIPAKRRLFLTGTPIINKPKEIWPMLQILDPDGLGRDWYDFATRYCGLFEIKQFNAAKGKEERIGWDWGGATNLEELQQRLRASIMVRRLKVDVLKQLPPIRRQIISIEPSATAKKLIAKEMKTYEQYKADLPEDQEPPSFHEISKIRKETAVAKIPFVIDYLKEISNEQSKVVVFGHHHEVLDKLAEVFPKECVRFDGRTSIEDRQAAVDSFQNNPTVRFFFGGIQAAGTGITLTASSTVVFAELDWTPSSISQAEARCHRLGQAKSVSVLHIVLAGSLDERMTSIVIQKQEISEKTLDKVSVV